jgi:hypothetical protein
MNTNADFDRNAAAWLADGPTELADRVLDAALHEVHSTPQRRRWSAPWRASLMSLRFSAAAVIALIAVAGIVAFNSLGGVGTSPTAAPSPTASPAPTAAVVAASLDPTGWPTYTSARYAFTIGHPADWTELPSTRAWSFELDSDQFAPRSAGAEHFTSADGQVRVSVWTVPLEAGQVIESWGDVEAWVGDYCERTGIAGCTAIHDRVVPLCIEKRDCHPALLVPFIDHVQAFGTGGVLPEGMLVIAVWRGESDPAVAPYGGSQHLLQAFLSTLNVWPPFYPESQQAAATFVATGK